MSLYKGYAQQRGFDPIKVPDPSEKIRRQGLRALQQMNENFEFERNQSRQIVQAFDDNFKLEENLRDQNFKDQKSYNEMMARAKFRNMEVSINDAKRKSARGNQTLNNLKAIAAFSQQAGDAYMKVETQRRKNIDSYVSSVVEDHDLQPWQTRALINAKEGLRAGVKDINTLRNELELQHVPIEDINKLVRAGGYTRFAINRAQAKRHAEGFDLYLARRGNETLDGFNMNLNTAIATNSPVLPAMLSRLSSDYSKDKEGNPLFDDKVRSESGYNATIRETKGKWSQRAARLDKEQSFKERAEDDVHLLSAYIGNKSNSTDIIGPEGLFVMVQDLAGNLEGLSRHERSRRLKAAKERVLAAAKLGIPRGQINYAWLDGIEDLKVGPGTGIEVPGLKGGKAVLASKHFPNFINDLKDLYKEQSDFEQREIDRAEGINELEGKVFRKKVRDLISNKDYNRELLSQSYSEAISRGKNNPNSSWTKAAQEIADVQSKHNNSENDAYGESWISSRVAQGMEITVPEIEALNMSVGATKKAKELLPGYSRLVPYSTKNKDGTRDRLEKAIVPKLNQLIKRTSDYGMSSTWGDQKLFAMSEAASYYRNYLETEGKSDDHEGAYKAARAAILKDMDSNTGDWERVTLANGQVEFKRGLTTAEDVIEINREQLGRELWNDPSLIHSKLYFDKASLKMFSSKVNKGIYTQMPVRASLIESASNGRVKGIDALQANLQLLRNQEIALTGASDIQLLPDEYVNKHRQLEKCLTPKGLAFANSYNLVDVNKGCMSTKQDGSIGMPAYNMTQVIKQERLTNELEEGKLDETQTAYKSFVLDRINNFLANKGDTFESPFGWRDPAVCNEETCKYLWGIGFYTQSLEQEVR
tara:strand:+ start:7 stop:2628 length:2622 start_codon:yes stop_codon:yes gene_type:complete